MIDPDALFRALDEKQKTYAFEFLSKPSGQDSFALGRAHGIVLGFEQAKVLILGMLTDEKDDKGGKAK